jgi:hypothetical protein
MDGTNMPSGASATASGPDPKAQFDELRIELHRNGYHPVPVYSHDQPVKRPGKQPAIKQWQKPVAAEAVIVSWSDRGGWRTAANTGLLTGEVAGIDIDVPDTALAAEVRALVESVLGPTPLVRVGAAPKVLLAYRVGVQATAVTMKIMTPELFLDDGMKLQVEILGQGQQFVAYGTHPDTKQPYRWEGASPLDTPVSDLPEVTLEQLLSLRDAAEKLLRAKGGLTKQECAGTKKKGGRGDAAAAAAAADDGESFFRRVNRAALDNIGAWAPELFPTGHFEKGTGAFRVSSADLGRALEEDLSIHPVLGARDFGEEISCSPIDIVMRYGAEVGVIDRADPLTGKAGVLTAAIWLCERLGIDPVTLGFRRERPEVAELILEFNAKHFVTIEGGATLVMTERYDIALGRTYYTRSRFRDIEHLYSNRFIKVREEDDGTPIRMPAGKLWLNHPERRTYLGGVVFDPSRGERTDQFNLWRGFAITPKPGDWSLMQRHMLEVISGGNIDHYMYLLGLMARMVQRPAETGEVVIVLRGAEGVGKGVLGRALVKLFGRHGLQVSNPAHLIGKFNEHLRDVVVLFPDECFFAGDPRHTGILKALATEPTLMIEPKGFPAFPVPNRLHIIMASNNDWVVPASLSSRRFFVLDVLPIRQGDRIYFNALWHQMQREGGLPAMLWDLLNDDLSGFDFRDIPTTAALIDQRKLSLPIPDRWWMDCLSRGFVFASKHGHGNYFGVWHEEVATAVLFDSYQEFSGQRRDRDPLSREKFGGFLTRMGGIWKRLPANTVVGESRLGLERHQRRPPGYRLGTLDQARAAFTGKTGLTIDWDH